MQSPDTKAPSVPNRVFCVSKAQSIDVEACYVCGTPCVEAESATGRSPDRDARLGAAGRTGIIALYR